MPTPPRHDSVLLDAAGFDRLPLDPTGPTQKLKAPATESARMRRVFQLLSSLYAVAMLVITVRAYVRAEEPPGLAVFFVACTACFYIICYHALSVEGTFKQWLEQHYPAFRRLSIALAVVLASIPVGVLYLMQPRAAAKPAPSPAATLPVAAASLPEIRQEPRAQRAADGSSAPAVLRGIRYRSGPASTTVTIDLDEAVQYEMHRLPAPDRIYLDLGATQLAPPLSGQRFQVHDALLRTIRVAEHEAHRTRITLETNHLCDYSITPIPHSHGLLIELHNTPGESRQGGGIVPIR